MTVGEFIGGPQDGRRVDLGPVVGLSAGFPILGPDGWAMWVYDLVSVVDGVARYAYRGVEQR